MKSVVPTPDIDPRLHRAVTDLCTYALVLDAERQRLSARADRVGRSDADHSTNRALEARRAEITKELEALRAMIAALRACGSGAPPGTRSAAG